MGIRSYSIGFEESNLPKISWLVNVMHLTELLKRLSNMPLKRDIQNTTTTTLITTA